MTLEAAREDAARKGQDLIAEHNRRTAITCRQAAEAYSRRASLTPSAMRSGRRLWRRVYPPRP
jgi:hypothetical protein